METQQKSMIIIGAGIAGLSMGIYARLNGYKTRILEMNSIPGGLMTAWKRKGYTIDGCIHWLTGSSRDYHYYRFWEEIGLLSGQEILNPEIFARIEGEGGQAVNLYTDTDRLERHLLEISPEDSRTIKEICRAIRGFSKWNPSIDNDFGSTIKSIIPMAASMPALLKWGRQSMRELGAKFHHPLLRFVFGEMWFPEMSTIGLMVTMAMLSKKGAGYPIGGSLPMAVAVEKRYLDLGGAIQYGARVNKILVENNHARGVHLVDGTELFADVVVSAADGHATIYDMLEGKFIDQNVNDLYDHSPLFPSLVFIGLGVKRRFPDFPALTSGLSVPLKQPFDVAGGKINRLETMIYNFDPTLAPEGKTAMTVMFPSSYEYWKQLSGDNEHYEAEKKQVALQVIHGLSERFPGLDDEVEMIDVATPLTFEHYTGNWKGSFEGWLPTPKAMMKPISKTLPGLEDFYMVGQWVQAGGGLPSGVMTAREVMKMICKNDGVKFSTTS
jgi:phytoene dehydrogenase-like protein